MSTHRPSQPLGEPAQITLVESEACHFCDDARLALADLAVSYPLTVETVDVRSETGQRLMQRHRAPMSPLVLVDGEFFSHGRFPRRKFEKVLGQRQSADQARVG